jgi:hypothetical protein
LAQLESQYQLHVVTNEQEDEKWYLAQKASEFIDTYVEKPMINKKSRMRESLVGSVAYPGVVAGSVRVVNAPEDMKDFKEGDIGSYRNHAQCCACDEKSSSDYYR